MTRFAIAAALALAATLLTVPAHAQSPRTFVSAAGNDSNPCSFAAPCRHFQAAVNATGAGGEVDALDPAGYSPIIINKAITIEGQGWSYIAPPAGGSAITINAVSGDVVIHGVSLNGVGIAGPTTGIQFNSGASLTVSDSVIRNFTGNGISFLPISFASISVSRTDVSKNGGAGILVQPQGSASATADFEQVRTQYNSANAYGISLDASSTTGTVNGTATDSVSSNNGGGYIAQGGSVSIRPSLTLVRSVAANNHTGVQGGSGVLDGHVIISQTAITNNVLGCNGFIETYLDNIVNGNGSDGACVGDIGNTISKK